MVKVFGHKSPDTDAVCAPLAYAWYLKQKNIDAEAFVLGELNREAKYVLESVGMEVPKMLELADADEVVIIDTNNPDELPENIGKANIKTIIDHHKLAGLNTENPLEIYMKPVGSSSTLVYQLMQEDGVAPTKEIATLLLSAILSDTLKFTSPTTTDEDIKAAEELAAITDLNMEKHAEAMFSAKSDLSGMSARDILFSDSKVFDFGGKKVRISNLETTKPDNAKGMIGEIKSEMEKLKTEEGLAGAYFFIVDILNTGSELVVPSEHEKKLAESAFSSSFTGDYMALPGVVSRKKQIAPPLEKAYTS